MRRIAAACAVVAATVFALPASAAPPRSDAERQQQQPGFTPDDPRDAAVHDCSVEASKWGMSTWQSTQIITYGECMTEHGQPP